MGAGRERHGGLVVGRSRLTRRQTMDLKTSLVLVTGATSPVGRSLVTALARGFPNQPELLPSANLRIRCLALPGEDFSLLRDISDRVQVLVGDLRHPVNVERLCHGAEGAVVFHLALARNQWWLPALRRVNVAATATFLQAAAKSGARRAVVLSEGTPPAGQASDSPLDESHAARPGSAWGALLAEREAAARAATGIETVLLRHAPLIAPDGSGKRPSWCELALEGLLPLGPHAAGLLSLATPALVAQACVRAAGSRQATGEIYWVANDPPCDVSLLCQRVRQLAEAEFPAVLAQVRASRNLTKAKTIAARVVGWLGLNLPGGPAAEAAAHPYAVSAAKARAQLGLQDEATLDPALRELLRMTLPPAPASNAESPPDSAGKS